MLNKHFSAAPSKLLNAEWLVLWGCFVASGMMLTGYPVLLPSAQIGEVAGMLTVTQQYGKLIGMIFCVYCICITTMNVYRKTFNLHRLLCDVYIFLRILLCLVMAIYLMQTFKWWSMMQPTLHDDFYWSIDQTFQPLKNLLLATEPTLNIPQIWYFHGFSYFFVIPYTLAILMLPDMFIRLATTNMAVMILGGIAYNFAPAYGPLIYSLANDSLMAATQQHMIDATNTFRASGHYFDPTVFDAVLGAMPSLHIAHVTAIMFVVWQYSRLAAMLCIAPLLFIYAYSVVTHFHYLVDIPAGILLAIISVYLANLTASPNGYAKIPAAN